MQIFRNLDEVPAGFGPSIVSVGNFDGVHCAHQKVLAALVQRARETGAKSVAVTFDPHPTQVLRSQAAPKLLTPLDRKLPLLEQAGIDAVLVLPFTAEFSLTTPLEFCERVLQKTLKAREVHEGFNFHFGHKAEGTVKRLAELGKTSGFEVCEYPEMRLRGLPVSSSHIRELVRSGDVSNTRALLGRPYSIAAPAISGRGIGTQLTVPTINLGAYAGAVPANGVYVTRTQIGTETFDSVTNVGNRPTFGADSFAIETHLLDFRPIALTPSAHVEVCFLSRLRDEKKFDSPDALKQQIGCDVARARRIFRWIL